MPDALDISYIGDTPLLKGVINRVQPRFIPGDAAVRLLNVDLLDPSAPAIRDGYVEVGAGTTGFTSASTRVSGLATLDSGIGSRFLAAAVNDSDSGGVFIAADPESPSGWSEVTVDGASIPITSVSTKMFQGNDLLWVLPGDSGNAHAITIGGLGVDGLNKPNSPPRGAVDGTWLFQRVWMLSGEDIYWSKIRPTTTDLEDEAAFDRSLQKLDVGSTGMGTPVAIAPWSGTSLIVYFDSSIVEVLVNNADPSLSAVRTVEPRIGCSARDSVISLGKEQYFLDQYGQYRSLTQTINASQQGVRAEPLSESAVKDIPERINRRHMHKATAELLDDRVYLFLPMDTETENKECWVWDTVRKSWSGPWQFAHPISATAVSNARNRGYDLYGANGNSGTQVTAVYRFFAGSYLDDGEDITYRETTRQFDLNSPHKDKTAVYAEVEAEGDIGASWTLAMRTNNNADYSEILDSDGVVSGTIPANSDADFPLAELGEVGADFPMAELGETGTPFPLAEATAQIITRGRPIDATTDFAKGRFVQCQIESTPSGKQFKRRGFRFAPHMDQHDTTGSIT